jgi:hypothetical protein
MDEIWNERRISQNALDIQEDELPVARDLL